MGQIWPASYSLPTPTLRYDIVKRHMKILTGAYS